MNRTVARPNAGAGSRGAGNAWQALARRAVRRRLRAVRRGTITIVEDGRSETFGRAGPGDPAAVVEVHEPGFWPRIAFGGSIGAGESYGEGQWSADDLPALMRILAREADSGVDGPLASVRRPLDRWIHRQRDNDRGGSRRNIAAHYDLGNDFYALFLDDTMTYSCGVFERADVTLREASAAKYERICRKLGLGPAHEVVEIGCGWGGFAEHAASRHGCRVYGTTISDRQFDYAVERIRRAGLGDRVTIVKEDYRDLPARLGRRFDRLVSIEMIEAVGHRHLDTFFKTCERLLRRDGLMALQAITIADQRYDAYRRSVDFIQRHIFPGGFLPSVTAVTRSLTRATDLTMVALEDIGRHYAETLRRWRERFLGKRAEVAALGLPERFVRMWEFYLAYCEGGFLERTVSDVQMILARPGARFALEGESS